MGRRILIAPARNRSKKTNSKVLSKDDIVSAIVSKIFVAAIGSVFVFVGSALLFRTFLSGIPVLVLAGCVVVVFAVFIFTRDNKSFTAEKGYKPSNTSFDYNDPMNAGSGYNINNAASPFNRRDPFCERN